MDLERKQVLISNPDPRDQHENAPRSFTFDLVFDWNSQQKPVFDSCALPIVNSVLEGYNGTIFAYGQTGTGKTHTMEGKSEPKELMGIIPRSFEHIFEQIDNLSHKQFLVRVQMLEIYNEKIRDLLSGNPNNNLELKENDGGVQVKDQSDFVVNSSEQMAKLLDSGKSNRVVGCTEMNKDSSRSHCVFTIIIEASQAQDDEQNNITRGKLNLVDLAGSERQSKTHAQGDRLTEAKSINQSLSCLGNVISALVDGKSQHIPYRNSKLTRILQDSLGGNTKTIMIANLGPACYNYDETISTLRQANRAKNIKNKPKINEDPKDAMLREFQDEITKLKQQLAALGGEGIDVTQSQVSNPSGAVNPKVIQKENQDKIKEMEKKMEEEKNEIKRKADQERKLIESQKNMAEEERTRLMQEIRSKEDETTKHQEEKIEMQKKLKTMETKLVRGTKAVEKAEQQEKILKQTYEELNKQRERESKLKMELDEKENNQLMLEKKYKNQEEEIKDKTSKLKKLWSKYSQINQELYDMKEEQSRDREDAQFNIRELNMELKLKNLILEQFIPYEEWLNIEKRAVWNEEMDNWILPKLELTGNMLKKQRPASALGYNRPTSNFSKQQKDNGSADPRHHSDNVLHMELDMPDRTTLDQNGQLHGHLAEQVNEDLSKVKEFRSQDNSVFSDHNKKQSRPTIKRPATAKNKGNLNNPDVDMIDKIEREKQQMKSFPLKK